MIKLLLITIIYVCVFSTSSFAWGPNGHRIIADIANRYLSDKTKGEVSKILEGRTLAQVSTNPDDMRSSKGSFKWQECKMQGDNINSFKCDDKEVQWSDTVDWHFINFDIERDFYEISKPEGENAFTIIRNSFSILSNPKANKQEKFNAIVWMIHLVGDIHQPLHLGNNSDIGGNKIKVDWFGKETNLHEVWDENLVEYHKLSYTEYSNFLFLENHKRDVSLLQKNCIFDWIKESNKLSRLAYKVHRDVVMGYDYVFESDPIIKDQLFKGGARLAQVLNAIFDSPNYNLCMN